MRLFPLLLTYVALFLPLTAFSADSARPADIVFLSDFGLQDDAAAQCKAAIYNVYGQARVTDMTHNIPPYNKAIASFLLADAAKVWPSGTVFLAVVDPGVGSSRKMVALRTKTGHIFVGPDNGLFTFPVRKLGFSAAVSLDNPKYFREGSSRPSPQSMPGLPPIITSTFHGRDIFAPVAAHLASKPSLFPLLGRQLSSLVMLDDVQYLPADPNSSRKQDTTPELPSAEVSTKALSGEIIYTEAPFGNVWTNIDAATIAAIGLVHGATITVELNGKQLSVPYVTTFSKVPENSPLAYVNSRGLFSLALNMGDFSKRFSIKGGERVRILLAESDIVDVMSMAGDLMYFDIRYATTNNFTGKKVYPEARCYLRRDAARALLKAAATARSISSQQFGICAHDCYRPLSVQKIFWGILPDERYVANPAKGSRHNRAMAVDVYPCDYSGKPLPAPTPYDDFSEKAHRTYTGAGKEATGNSRLLESIMADAGFVGMPTEWWHYDYSGWEKAPVLDQPFSAD